MRGVYRSRECKDISKAGSIFENLFSFGTEVCFFCNHSKDTERRNKGRGKTAKSTASINLSVKSQRRTVSRTRTYSKVITGTLQKETVSSV